MSELYQRLKKYCSQDYYPYHMPGHKRHMQGRPLEDAYGIDITEIDGFDNLHHAEGILKEIQLRAARLWKSDETHFLINGSTSGLLTAIAAVSNRGEVLLMDRNCHKAAYHGAYLHRLELSYLYPEISEEFQIAEGISAEEVKRELKKLIGAGKRVAAVLVTSPTYEGITSPIAEISAIAHEYGIPLIVDEAHGAHFGFCKGYPDSAVHQGADLVIQSVHKTLPAMTQTALLHVNGEIIDRERVRRFLGIYQTSSPSYVLMTSIDVCMDVMEQEGRSRLERCKKRETELLEFTKDFSIVKLYDRQGKDPLKIVISADRTVMTGKQLYDILLEEYHLQMEMSAGSYCLAMFSMMDDDEAYERLKKALGEIEAKYASMGERGSSRLTQPRGFALGKKRESILPLWKAYDFAKESVGLKEAEHRIAADFVHLYPPGIPLIVPGDRIDRDFVESIMMYQQMGLTVMGLSEDGYEINVLREDRVPIAQSS